MERLLGDFKMLGSLVWLPERALNPRKFCCLEDCALPYPTQFFLQDCVGLWLLFLVMGAWKGKAQACSRRERAQNNSQASPGRMGELVFTEMPSCRVSAATSGRWKGGAWGRVKMDTWTEWSTNVDRLRYLCLGNLREHVHMSVMCVQLARFQIKHRVGSDGRGLHRKHWSQCLSCSFFLWEWLKEWVNRYIHGGLKGKV